ncbi:MAG: ABC transporter permease [Gemmatimonadota bacterium]|nr:ABC transporter permease [Gemmatimonadota bacterium]
MDGFRQDLRFAFRSLRRRPGFTLVAVLTIAIGIGANSAIFSVVDAVLIEPIPVHEPSRLLVPDVVAPTGFSISLSIPNLVDWRDRNRTFASFASSSGRSRTLTGGDRAEVVRTRWILGDFFETLGVSPAQGRVIPADETFAGAPAVAVITHGFWQRHFGGERALGETLLLDDQPFTVVGVMPPSFRFPDANTEIYLPMGFYQAQLCWDQRGCSQGAFGIGRLRDGVTIEAAQQDLDRIVREIEETEGQRVARPVLEPLVDYYVGDIRRNLWLMMGAVGFVLLIACANVASLTLARGEARRREVALRSSLGAGRGRVMRQFLTESMVLAALGGVVGLGVAWLGIRALVPVVADSLPSALTARIGLDPTVLIFTAVATLVAGVVFGIAPTLRASRTDLVGELKEGSRGGGSGRNRNALRSALVVAEVALSLVLLIGAGLMIQSIRQLRHVDKGFAEDNLFTAEVPLPRARYDGRDAAWPFFRELHRRVAALPGVERASLTQILPLEGSSWEQGIYPEGVEYTQDNVQSVLYYMVTPEHFDVFQIPLLAGRGFEAQDRDGGDRVAIIDETMAERFWPGESAIGRRVTFESTTDDAGETERIFRTVVGVVKNVRHYELENAARITIYVPFEQTNGNWTGTLKLVAATSGDPTLLTDAVRRELSALDPEVPLAEVQTMETVVDQAMSGPRALGTLLGVFAAVALGLSAIGLFGLMSYIVAQSFREIGIRMALGASAGRVVTTISGQGLRLAALGVGLGLAAAVVFTRLLGTVLYEVDPMHLGTFAAFSLFLLAVAGAAAWIPARRATRIDPGIVLRQD